MTDLLSLAEREFATELLADKGLTAEVVADLLSPAQRRAILSMDAKSSAYRSWHTASEIGTNGTTLFALNDLWWDERDCEPPIMLVTFDASVDPWGVSRIWSLTGEGQMVAAALRAIAAQSEVSK